MEARGAAAAAVFLWTFVVLALGRVTAWPIARGWASLVGGLVTALILRLSPAVIDVQVMLLLAGLMVMAGLAEAAGLFAGLRRTLVQLPAWQALWASCALMALVSAALLNDAAVVVLIPFLLPALRGLGVPVVPAVALLAVASNLGSLLTPFGNPVVPPVYCKVARSSGDGRGSGNRRSGSSFHASSVRPPSAIPTVCAMPSAAASGSTLLATSAS